MTIFEYFKYAYLSGAMRTRRWMLRAFSMPRTVPLTHKDKGELYFDDDLQPWCLDDDLNPLRITGHTKGKPLYGVKDPVTVNVGDFKIVDKTYNTFYSNLFLNVFLLDMHMGDSIPFQNKTFSGGMLDKLIVKHLKDKSITVDMYRGFTKSMAMISALAPVITPSATYKGIVPPKGLKALRDKLLAEHKDDLSNPIVIADIEHQLVAYYKEYIKGDDAEGYYIDSKGMNIALKRSAMMFGGEPTLEDSGKMSLNVPSLMEGWDLDKLPDMINSLRMGSFSRGKETALGGEAAKFSSRVYQNTKLGSDDCKTQVGVPFIITSHNVNAFDGRYVIVNNKSRVLEPGELKSKIGQTVVLRSPMTCHEPNGNYCAICMGDEVTQSGIGIGVMASAVSSIMLNVFMSKMHGRLLEHAKYKYQEVIQ